MGIFYPFILFFPFLSPQTAVEGSCYGITLWSTQLLPSLLPCFILTKLIRQACPSLADKPCYLLMGTLCGYPVGASLVASQYTQGILSQKKPISILVLPIWPVQVSSFFFVAQFL